MMGDGSGVNRRGTKRVGRVEMCRVMDDNKTERKTERKNQQRDKGKNRYS